MKKAVLRMIVVMMLAAACWICYLDGDVYAGYQEKKAAEEPKLSVEQHDKIMTFETQALQTYIQLQQVQKKYDDMRNADPTWVAATQQQNQITGQLTDYLKASVMKGVDDKKWQFNLNSMKYEPVTPAVAPPPTPKP